MNLDVFTGFGALGSTLLGSLLAFLVVLTIVVFFHELGHFLVARWAGVKVLVFSIGFGKELFGFNDRYGTRWKVSAIPLGGYVKFFGDENAASVPDTDAVAKMTPEERKLSFIHQKVGPRAAIVAAGPIANFILAIVIFAVLFTLYGKPSTTPRVDTVQAGTPAAEAGFQPGDLVLAIDGRPIETFNDMQRVVSGNAGSRLTITVDRGGARRDLTAVPALREQKDSFGNVHRIGVLGITRSLAPDDARTTPVDPITAIGLGFNETWFVVERTLSYIGKVIVGRESADQLGGPLMIAQASGQMASLGVTALFNFIAVLSISIGLLNLFPVPLLDGGHLLFYAIEVVRGRPLPERAQEYGFRVGLVLVVALMVFALKNDVFRLLNLWTS